MKNFTLLSLFMLFISFTSVNAQLPIFTEGYAAGITFAAFGGSTNNLTEDATTAYTGTKSLKIDVTSGYTGGALVAAMPQNLSTYNAVSFWVKASAAKTLNVSGLGNNGADNSYQSELPNVALTTTWTKVVIPIPNPAKFTAATGLFHFAEGSDEGAYTIWMDDIQYETTTVGTATAAMATESITKSIGDTFSPNGVTCSFNGVTFNIMKAWFNYTSSNTGVATMNNTTGVGTAVAGGTTNVTATMGATVVAGTLTVNVTAAPSGPTVAAPTPTRLPADVISVFSNAYTDLAGTDFFPNWSQTTVVTEEMIAGNATKKYANFNYQGTQFATPIDASTMQTLHIDYWSSTMNSFDVFLINIPPLAQVEQKVTVTPTLSGWNSLDIPLASYTAINKSGIGQFKLEGRPSGGIVYLDNIYFYKSAVVAPTAPTVAAPTPTRLPANVISVFSNAYTDLTGTDFFPNWSQTTVVTEEMIAGNATKKYANFNYQGTQFATPIDASTMQTLHIDYWSSTMNSFQVYLINVPPLAQLEQQVTVTPTLSGWNTFDIPLASYTNINKSGIGQFKLEGTPSGGIVYLDNIYFWKPTVVPVELTYFKAKTANNASILTWQTASESNNQGFTIERSNNGTTFSAIGNVKGNGTTNAASNYTFTDATPSNGVNYYRLRQTDVNGKEETSKVVSVAFGKNVLALKNTLVQNTLEVIVSESEKTPLSIFNVSGQLVFSATVQGTQVLDMSHLTAGLYIVRTATGEARRFVKN